MKKILASGSLAYDVIYTFPGVFQDELMADAEGNLSVAFNMSNKTVHFGGCAGNVAFNAKLLKEDVLLLGIAGKDFADYKKWLNKHSISTSHVIIDESDYTAQAAVANDQKGQQITFFYEGAAKKSETHKEKIRNAVRDNAKDINIAIISPNNRIFVLASVEACKEFSIPFFFDPGQVLPLFSASELTAILKSASGLFLNEYELALFKKQTNLELEEILKLCSLVIVTLGEKGARIYFKEKQIAIPAIKLNNPVDPTGCGDAFRAGFLISIKNSLPHFTEKDLIDAANSGTRIASACLKYNGTQNHHLDY